MGGLKINNNKMSPHQNMPVLVIFVPATYAIIDLILTKFPKQFYRNNLFGDKKTLTKTIFVNHKAHLNLT